METKKIELLENYLSLYINHFTVLENMEKEDSPYVLLDVRNAPKEAKKEQIKGATALPAKELENRLDELDKGKIYVVYDWNSGTILGKQALLLLLKSGFEAFELAGALEGWKGMDLPMEAI